MSAALIMLLFAVAVAWWLPSALTRLTAIAINPRLGMTAWLAAMVGVLGCLLVAIQCLVSASVAGWAVLAEAVCRSATGHACPPTVYQSAIFEIPLAAVALGATLSAAVLAWRYGRNAQRGHQRTSAHAEVARMAGRRLPSAGNAVVLDVAQPAAYCVPGRPAAIVLTSGALDLLEPAQLTAVIAHERAHLAGNHHVLIALARGLAASFPGVPLFTRGAAEVARLAEMRADDEAVRTSGRPILVSALLAMGTCAAMPAVALSATGGDVAARVQRLLAPPRSHDRIRNLIALLAVIAVLAVASGLLTLSTDPLVAQVVTAVR